MSGMMIKEKEQRAHFLFAKRCRFSHIVDPESKMCEVRTPQTLLIIFNISYLQPPILATIYLVSMPTCLRCLLLMWTMLVYDSVLIYQRITSPLRFTRLETAHPSELPVGRVPVSYPDAYRVQGPGRIVPPLSR